MSIRHFGHMHATVREVRECTNSFPSQLDKVAEAAETQRPITEKMYNYIWNLLNRKELPAGFPRPDEVEGNLQALPFDEGKVMIGKLLTFPDKPKAKFDLPDVPAGRYALLGDDEVWRFYQVDRPEEGKWKGYTFTKQLIGAPGNYRQIPIKGKPAFDLLTKLFKDPRQASVDYGLKSEHCGICGSELSNNESLKYGIGPICRAKMGW